MTKRRFNKQQAARIKKIQTNYIHENLEDISTHEEGLVLSRFGKHAEIEFTNKQIIHCAIRPNIDSLVAGDRVIWQPTGHEQGVVVCRFPRETELGRPDKRGIQKPVAANITQMMIVVAPKPELSFPLLDSYLIMAEHLQLKATIVLNKVDLPCVRLQNELLSYYQAFLGYTVILTSKEDGSSSNPLQHSLIDHTSVFVGQSGVGKSSLIAGILPHEKNIQTADISTQSQLGCHTTSNSRLYHLPTGGSIIDSPGVREFSVWQMPLSDIIYGFREIRGLVSSCKYRNCIHQNTPGCAIIEGLKNNTLSLRRYESMIKLSKKES